MKSVSTSELYEIISKLQGSKPMSFPMLKNYLWRNLFLLKSDDSGSGKHRRFSKLDAYKVAIGCMVMDVTGGNETACRSIMEQIEKELDNADFKKEGAVTIIWIERNTILGHYLSRSADELADFYRYSINKPVDLPRDTGLELITDHMNQHPATTIPVNFIMKAVDKLWEG